MGDHHRATMSEATKCPGICMDQGVKDQLNRIEDAIERNAKDTARLVRAVYGELENGMPGLVRDVSDLKTWKDKQVVKTAGVAGAVTGGLFGLKAILAKIVGP